MKIVLTAGGTGGHFYPLIAIAEAIHDLSREQNLITPALYYLADKPYDEEALFANSIIYQNVPAGKIRRYFSLQNVSDMFVTLWGVVVAFFTLLKIFPDVVVSKGSYSSVPVVIAANALGIPVITHESDSRAGRANLLAAKKAVRIGVAFESAAAAFPEKVRSKIAKIGIPVRKELLQQVPKAEAIASLKLDPSLPTVFIVGGSTGAAQINETVLGALPDLVAFANVVHQIGRAQFDAVAETAQVILEKAGHAERYHPYPYLNAASMIAAGSAADVIISRAGSTAITEISLWGKPAILIPIPEEVSHDQRSNAYAFAHTGGAVVLEESNLTPHVLASEAHRIATTPELNARMSAAGRGFADPNAARVIATEALRIVLEHQKK